MIQSVTMRGIKNAHGKQELTGRDIIIGPNGAGKTTRAQALGIALTGYVPGGGKLPSETMKLSRGDSMVTGIETEDLTILRQFTRKGAKIEQSLMILPPPANTKTLAELDAYIDQKLGKCPVMLDFGEFLNLSDMKRREFIYSLAGSGAESGADAIERALAHAREQFAPPESADPRESEIFDADLNECFGQPDESMGLQAGLLLMYEYAKQQTAFWKKERDKSAGASQKIAEYKNELDETDRNLDANKKTLGELHAEYAQTAAELAKIEADNRRAEESNKKIEFLRAEIAVIEASENNADADGLRALISQYAEDIRKVDNCSRIAEAAARMEDVRKRLPELERAVEKQRDDYQYVRSLKESNESLIAKLEEQSGRCPIDCRIECGKDFSALISDLMAENDGYVEQMVKIKRIGSEAKEALDEAKDAAAEAQVEIDALRAEELSALRENEQLQEVIRDFETQLRVVENFDADKSERLASTRGELAGMLPPDGGAFWPVEPVDDMDERVKWIDGEIKALSKKIDDQSKARNTLVNLKASIVDSVVAGYHADAWKRIAEYVGPKGLQGELVKDALSPLTRAVQDKLEAMGVSKSFYFQTEDEKGKELFQFGWSDITEGDGTSARLRHAGNRRNFDALSTGEQMLLLVALMTVIIERLNPPLKILMIDNAENLDAGNLERVLNGIYEAGRALDNIIFLGVMNLAADAFPGWNVIDLGVSAAAGGDEREAVYA